MPVIEFRVRHNEYSWPRHAVQSIIVRSTKDAKLTAGKGNVDSEERVFVPGFLYLLVLSECKFRKKNHRKLQIKKWRV